jgi:hypothetical protein
MKDDHTPPYHTLIHDLSQLIKDLHVIIVSTDSACARSVDNHRPGFIYTIVNVYLDRVTIANR